MVQWMSAQFLKFSHGFGWGGRNGYSVIQFFYSIGVVRHQNYNGKIKTEPSPWNGSGRWYGQIIGACWRSQEFCF